MQKKYNMCKCSNCDSNETLVIHRQIDGVAHHGIWCRQCEILNADETIVSGLTKEHFQQLLNIDTSMVCGCDIFTLSCVNIGVDSFMDSNWPKICDGLKMPELEIVYRRQNEKYSLYCLFD